MVIRLWDNKERGIGVCIFFDRTVVRYQQLTSKSLLFFYLDQHVARLEILLLATLPKFLYGGYYIRKYSLKV